MLAGAAAAVVLVLVAVGALVLRDRNRTIVDSGPSPTTSASGGRDTSPAETPGTSPSPAPVDPTGPGATPGTTTGTTPGPAPSSEPCPIGDPLTRQDHPEDGRVHGGGLSFLPAPGWAADTRAATLSWAYDVGDADEQVRGTWFTGAAVGALSVVDAPDVQSAAELMMSCTASPFLYTNLASRTDLVSQATRFEGLPAWRIRSEIRVDNPYVQVPGDVVEVTVVDLGSPESFAFFWGTAPLDDTVLIGRLDAAARSVQTD